MKMGRISGAIKIPVLTLGSVSLPRKFIALLDVPYTLLFARDRHVFMVGPSGYLLGRKAMVSTTYHSSATSHN
jgi:hypothetical protein